MEHSDSRGLEAPSGCIQPRLEHRTWWRIWHFRRSVVPACHTLNRPRQLYRSGAAIALLLIAPRLAKAESATATAQALFEQGRDLLREGHVAEACPKLTESQRLEPATGTLLALAMCHEAEGKLASAWAEFTEVAVRAGKDGQLEREAHSRSKSSELKPRLSTLEVQIPAAIAAYPGLEVERNGMRLGEGAWNMSVPVDGGEYRLEVRATGRETWHQTFTVLNERDHVVVLIPPLQQTPSEADAPSPGQPPTEVRRPGSAVLQGQTAPVAQDEPAPRSEALKWTGAALVGAGAASWLVGGSFFWAAYNYKQEAEQTCRGQEPECSAGHDQRNDAWVNGERATAFGIAGAAAVLGGAALYWWGGQTPTAPSTQARVAFGPNHWWLGVTGSL